MAATAPSVPAQARESPESSVFEPEGDLEDLGAAGGGGGGDDDDEFGEVWEEVERAAGAKRLRPSAGQARRERGVRFAVTNQVSPAAAPAGAKADHGTDPGPGPEPAPAPAPPAAPVPAAAAEDVEAEAAVWDEVNRIRAEEDANAAAPGAVREVSQRPIITYADAARFLLAPERTAPFAARAKPRDFRKLGVFRRALYWVCGPPRLGSAALEEERDAVFCVALAPMDNAVAEHLRVLQTVYKCVSGDERDCPRVGAHWEDIGFQGADPATDLRGAGMFGLLQMLHFLRVRRALARRIYQLSRDERQRFPFALVSLNITGMVLQALREGRLHRECRSRGSVLGAAHALHAALFYELLLVWKREFCTIQHFGAVRKRLAEASRTRTRDLLRAFRGSGEDAEAGEVDELEFAELP